MNQSALDQAKTARKNTSSAPSGGRRQRRRPAPPPDDAPGGAAALSIWFGAIALLSVIVRITLGERGEGAAAGARWLGVFGGCALIAGVVWLLARRSARWFHRTLAPLLLAATVVLVARWGVERAAMKQRDQKVYELLAAMDAATGEELERIMDEIDSLKGGASRSTRLSTEILVATRRETHRTSVEFKVASDKLEAARVLDMSTVKSQEDIKGRMELARTFGAAAEALNAHLRAVQETLQDRLRAVTQDNPQNASLLGHRDEASEKERGKLGALLREGETRWAAACVDMLALMEERWGTWKIEPVSGVITFEDGAAQARYEAAIERVDRTFVELQGYNAQLRVLNVTVPKTSVIEARASFVSQLRPITAAHLHVPLPAPFPPPSVLQRVRYRAPAGQLAAYVSPDPRDGKKHPAVLWAHGGFEGIGAFVWEPAAASHDESARAFREAGLVLMVPSVRGENDNPGRFELFNGELDDLLAAFEHLASLPYVDRDRIYLAGHSAGGTLVLLAAAAQGGFRAVFSFGGIPEIGELARARPDTPFDPASADEIRVRSPVNFAGAIHAPTFYFEGVSAADVPSLRLMEARAGKAGAPFHLHFVYGGNHFDILDPLTHLVAQKIGEDMGAGHECNIRITDDEVQKAFAARRRAPAAPAPPAPLP